MRPTCPKCRAPLPPWALNTDVPVPCPACGTPQATRAFPALFRQGRAGAGAALSEGEAGCFFHPARRAAAVCSACGRFLCSLCEIQAKEGVVCPSCLAGRDLDTGEGEFVSRRSTYDHVVMGIAVLPMLAIWPTIITAPLTWVVALKHWRSPISLVRTSRWRFPAALAIATLQMAGWTVFFILI